MTRLTRLCRAVGVGLAVATATLAMTQVAHAEPAPPTVPDATIAAPAGNEVFLVGHVPRACRSTRATARHWVLPSVPRGRPGRRRGKLIIKHFAGPTWHGDADGSSVVAAKVEGVVATTARREPAAIPWLLLQATNADRRTRRPTC